MADLVGAGARPDADDGEPCLLRIEGLTRRQVLERRHRCTDADQADLRSRLGLRERLNLEERLDVARLPHAGGNTRDPLRLRVAEPRVLGHDRDPLLLRLCEHRVHGLGIERVEDDRVDVLCK